MDWLGNLAVFALFFIIIAIMVYFFIFLGSAKVRNYFIGKKVTIALVQKTDDKSQIKKLINVEKKDYKFYYEGLRKEIKNNPQTLYLPRKRISLIVSWDIDDQDFILDSTFTIDPTRKTEYIISIPNQNHQQNPDQSESENGKEQS